MSESRPRKPRPPRLPDDDPRAALAEAFFALFLADWRAGGKTAIEKMRADKPGDYVKLAGALLPKEFAARDQPLDELTDAEIAARIAQLVGGRAAASDGGAGATGEDKAT